MARVAGVDLPRNKSVFVGLSYIYGIGLKTGRLIAEKCGIDPNKKIKDLTEEEVGKLNREIAENYIVEGDLRRLVQSNIKRLIEIGTYRGSRHRKNLPVRGQRTSTNARTRRGKRKTVGSVRPGSKSRVQKKE
ncbi:MAG: 30S ribosomal protein S13 [bacterium]|nr:30S ribosomal protein S13 [bacterium]